MTTAEAVRGYWDSSPCGSTLVAAPHPENVIAEIHRLLRPGGQVRAMLYNRRSLCAVELWARQLIRGRFASVRSVLADCLESPGTKAYTERELREMFSAFRDVNVK